MSSWQGWGITFSDGMCPDCAARARAEWSLPNGPLDVTPARRRRRSLRPDFALASFIVLAAAAVTFGLLVGPSGRQEVSQPVTEPSLLAGREADEAPASVPAPATKQPAPRDASATRDRSSVGAASPRSVAPPVVAQGQGDRTAFAQRTAPARVARAATKRRIPVDPSTPLGMTMQTDPVDVGPIDVVVAAVVSPAPRTAPSPAASPARAISPLDTVPVQAP